MKYVPPAFENEILKDTTEADFLKRAKRRMDAITATPDEEMLYKCDPNGARDNDRPGIPCEDYGTMTDD